MGDVVMANQVKVDTSATESMVPSDVEAVVTTHSTRLAACSAFDRPRSPGKSFLWFEEFAILSPLYCVAPVDGGITSAVVNKSLKKTRCSLELRI